MLMTPTRPRRWLAAAALTASLALSGTLAACGDDDDEGSGTTTTEAGDDSTTTTAAKGADVEEYCAASLAVETFPEPGGPDGPPDPAAIKAFFEGIAPLLETMSELAPGEIAEAADFLAAEGQRGLAGEEVDPESPEFTEAETTVHTYDLDNCGWEQVDVVGIDYAFEGVPTTLPAGTTSFEFTNNTEMTEAHEAIIFRKKDGVTETTQELLALPEEEAMAKVDMVAAVFAPPGDESYSVADLEAGDYAMVCFIAVGGGEDGPPHFTQGMLQEFTVE